LYYLTAAVLCSWWYL